MDMRTLIRINFNCQRGRKIILCVDADRSSGVLALGMAIKVRTVCIFQSTESRVSTSSRHAFLGSAAASRRG